MKKYIYILIGAALFVVSTFAEDVVADLTQSVPSSGNYTVQSIEPFYVGQKGVDSISRIEKILWESVDRGDLGMIEKLLSLGVNPDVACDYKQIYMALLHVAVIHQNLEMVQLIVKYEAAIDTLIPNPDVTGDFLTSLGVACMVEAKDIFFYLLEKYIDADMRFDTDPHAADYLFAAIKWGNVAAAKQLLERGANPNATLTLGEPPFPMHALHCAVMHQNLEMVQLLIEYKAKIDPTMPNPNVPGDYVTPLAVAFTLELPESTTLIVDATTVPITLSVDPETVPITVYLIEKYIEADIPEHLWMHMDNEDKV